MKSLKDAFNGSFIDVFGNKITVRTMETSRDFLREAKRKDMEYQKNQRKADMRFAKYGKSDKRGREFQFAANAAKHSAENMMDIARHLTEEEKKKDGAFTDDTYSGGEL